MRQTFEELIDKVKEDAQIVGIDFTVVIYNDVLALLKLVREKTLEECIVAVQSTKFEADTAILELSKDSIELEPYKSEE